MNFLIRLKNAVKYLKTPGVKVTCTNRSQELLLWKVLR